MIERCAMSESPSMSERERFAEAVAIANVPTLVMVLVQLTGDLNWLDEPYRIRRGRGLGDNDTGGLSEERQSEIREAALEAILAWRNGRPPAIPEPDADLLVTMLSRTVAEPVSDEYGPFTAAQLGFRPLQMAKIPVPVGFKALIVGAGASGIIAAANLQQAGIPFTIIEKNDRVGGVWYENRYPGAGVDTPNHLYSFSFVPYDWPAYFSLRDELFAYMEHAVRELGLERRIELETELVSAEWEPATATWRATIRQSDGCMRIEHANILISATGQFNPPVWPEIEGIRDFDGPSFHAARWPDGIDLAGKRVAVIGNGASAMQICPAIQDRVRSLVIFQRSNHWAAPIEHFQKPVPDPIRFLINEVPLYRAWYRVRLGWNFNDRVHESLQKDPDWHSPDRSLNEINDAHRRYYTHYIKEQLGDRQDLLPKVLPKDPPYGKRMLMDNGWYQMLRNPQIELVDTSIVRVRGYGIETADRRRREVDVLVVATGFDVRNFGTAFELRGRSGRTLREIWGDDGRAYMGALVPDYPNFFMLYGPNTQPGHGGSLIFMIEMQMHYLMDLLRKTIEGGYGSVEVRPEVHERFNLEIDRRHENMVWTHPGMETYYRNEKGRVVVNTPYRNVDFFHMTRSADLGEFVMG
jgi:4-hydroxyacetophenone monooxygenase